MNNRYLTLKDQIEYDIIIDKSRFICVIKRASTEIEAAEFIQSIKKRHYNATHNCSCYMIGEERMHQKANDDGEPSGTAGIPMLEVLRKNHLTDLVVVVTRYFGGIKLGAGGLIRAYGGAVSEAIKQATVVERKRMQEVSIVAEYADIGILDSRLTRYSIIHKQYLEKVTYTILVDLAEIEAFSSWFINLTNDKIPFNLGNIVMIEVDVNSED
jgi:uncharacterized YigZ family protein